MDKNYYEDDKFIEYLDLSDNLRIMDDKRKIKTKLAKQTKKMK